MDAAEALRFLQRMARAGEVRVSPKAQHEFLAAYGGRAEEITAVWLALSTATAAHVHKLAPDHADPSRTVIVLRLPFAGGSTYVKASLRRVPTESATALSCTRWER